METDVTNVSRIEMRFGEIRRGTTAEYVIIHRYSLRQFIFYFTATVICRIIFYPKKFKTRFVKARQIRRVVTAISQSSLSHSQNKFTKSPILRRRVCRTQFSKSFLSSRRLRKFVKVLTIAPNRKHQSLRFFNLTTVRKINLSKILPL